MPKTTNIEPVRLIAGLIYSDQVDHLAVLGQLEKKFGKIEFESETFLFNHTDYYRKEMGQDLKRGFVSFARSVLPDSLKDAKLTAGKVESKFANDAGGRMVNIDPGTVSLANLVLVSTKDFNHRIYLGDGIYGEVTMIYQDKAFQALPWTYPDYKRTEVADFLLRVRSSLKEEIIGLRNK